MLIFFKYFWSISFIFIICWAPEAPGPLPDCRSHFSASNRGIESFWNLQNTSFMTKQCPKTSQNIFWFCFKYFIFFIISWALEALGPFPNCRSHFSAQTRIIESFWNLQNTSFMTKQCPKTSQNIFWFCFKYFIFFIISWALEALGPFPNCRSHFSAQTRIIESFWNLQNTSFMTKQCSKTSQHIFWFFFLSISFFL